MDYLEYLKEIIHNLTGVADVVPPEGTIDALTWYIQYIDDLLYSDTSKPPSFPSPQYDDTELRNAITALQEKDSGHDLSFRIVNKKIKEIHNEIESVKQTLDTPGNYQEEINLIQERLSGIENLLSGEGGNITIVAPSVIEIEKDLTGQITGNNTAYLLDEAPGEEYALYYNGVRQRRVMYEIELESLILTTHFETIPKQNKDALVFVYRKNIKGENQNDTETE